MIPGSRMVPDYWWVIISMNYYVNIINQATVQQVIKKTVAPMVIVGIT